MGKDGEMPWLSCQQYVEDTQLQISFIIDVTKLSECLQMKSCWLKQNPDKTKVTLTRRGKCFEELDETLSPHSIEDIQPPFIRLIWNLMVLFDSSLSLAEWLQLAGKLHPFFPGECLVTWSHVFVTPRLDYCNFLYLKLNMKTMQRLLLV